MIRILVRLVLALFFTYLAVGGLFGALPGGPVSPLAVVLWALLGVWYWTRLTAAVQVRRRVAQAETAHIETPRRDPFHVEVDLESAYPIRTLAEVLQDLPPGLRADFEPQPDWPVYRAPNLTEEQVVREILARHGLPYSGPIPVHPQWERTIPTPLSGPVKVFPRV